MEKCLQSIYYLMINQINNDNIELNKLIMFLIHSVPIPINRNSKLKFYIPYYNNGIEIACPNINDTNIININVSMLFKWFSIDNIIIILRLILFEQKLLFVDDNYERLSNVIDIFISLISFTMDTYLYSNYVRRNVKLYRNIFTICKWGA